MSGRSLTKKVLRASLMGLDLLTFALAITFVSFLAGVAPSLDLSEFPGKEPDEGSMGTTSAIVSLDNRSELTRCLSGVLINELLSLLHDVLREEAAHKLVGELIIADELVQKSVIRGGNQEGLSLLGVLDESTTIGASLTIRASDELSHKIVSISSTTVTGGDAGQLQGQWVALELHIRELALGEVEVEFLFDCFSVERLIGDLDRLHFSCYPFGCLKKPITRVWVIGERGLNSWIS
nr:MAG TPA: hypothetical protein [Caudoviricetes sp.]